MWKLTARIIDTFSVFMYQAAIFYVQMNIFNVALVCETDGGCSITSPKSNIMAWLYIEITCFYLYMVSTVCYIAYSMVFSICTTKRGAQSDMSKTITDFLGYTQNNLIWFALNFVLFLMPLICVISLNPKAEKLDVAGAT